MSYPTVINEVASAVNAVINVITWSVIKILPVLVALLIGLIAIDIVIGTMFESDVQTESPFLSETGKTDIQLTANVQANPSLAHAE